jgi:molybdopterin-guanine dinucleotide biosynthesis protein A
MSTVTGVILAGGQAKRMGSDKALVEFRGLPMIRQVASALRAAGLDVLVVGRDWVPDGEEVVPDVDGLGGGPAVGLLTAFRHLPASDLLLVAVDQPLLRPETIRHLVALDGAAVVPEADGHPQVTCALYRQECHEALEVALASGQSKLRRLLLSVETNLVLRNVWATWGEDGRSWLSLDTPEAVRKAEALP